MHTVTIQIDRTGAIYDHKLSKETIYIASCEDQPRIEFSIDCDQSTFDQYKEKLRYDDAGENSRQEAIAFFQKLTTKIFDDIESLRVEGNKQTSEWLHLRLLMADKELVQLPFELALTPKGFQGQYSKPFLLNPQCLATMTREVKQVAPPDYIWPYKPRILFVWADPNDTVPYEEHFAALRDIIKEMVSPIKDNPEPIPDIGQLITEVKNASLKSISDTIRTGIAENNPYTHIHVLAHGGKGTEKDSPDEFKVVLHDNEEATKAFYVKGQKLAMAMLETDGNATQFPAVVSLMVCDSSNTGSVTLPEGGLAHQLHESGIPCVFGSQFPLSKKGSVELVKTLYKHLLLDGNDPRIALYDTRRVLDDNNVHDWASLVAHVRFPKDMNEQLKDFKLKVLLESLKTSNAWSEHVLKYQHEIAVDKFGAVLEDISKRLDRSIKNLYNLLDEEPNSYTREERHAEHAGLLGSAFKRKAEHLFRLSKSKKELVTSLFDQSREAIKSARDLYLNGFINHRKNNWTGIQYLSLAAISEGSLDSDEKREIWGLIKVLTQDTIDKKAEDPLACIWAWGTMMELYLLKPFTYPAGELDKQIPAALEKAKSYAGNLSKAGSTFIAGKRTMKQDIIYIRESTIRQVERYISWWPEMYPDTFRKELKEMATAILNELVKN